MAKPGDKCRVYYGVERRPAIATLRMFDEGLGEWWIEDIVWEDTGKSIQPDVAFRVSSVTYKRNSFELLPKNWGEWKEYTCSRCGIKTTSSRKSIDGDYLCYDCYWGKPVKNK